MKNCYSICKQNIANDSRAVVISRGAKGDRAHLLRFLFILKDSATLNSLHKSYFSKCNYHVSNVLHCIAMMIFPNAGSILSQLD